LAFQIISVARIFQRGVKERRAKGGSWWKCESDDGQEGGT